MAANTVLNLGTGGDTLKTDDVGSYKVGCSKIVIGASGADGGVVTTGNPFPVAVQGTVPVSGTVAVTGTFWQTTQPVSGTVGVSGAVAVTGTFFQATQPVSASALPLPTGASTETTLAGLAAKLGSLGQKAMTASAPVVLASDQTSIPVTGTFFQATQPVSASALPLPTGAATETTLAAINAKFGSLGQKAMSASSPVVIASDQASIPVAVGSLPSLAAGNNLIGRTSASNETSTIYNGFTALTPKFAVISASASGDNTVIAAVTGKKIRVLRFAFVAAAAVTAKFRTGTSGDIYGAMAVTANGGHGASYCPVGIAETVSGEALVLNLSAAVAVGGNLTYVEV